MANLPNFTVDQLQPTKEEIEKILTAKISYENAQTKPNRDTWNKANFARTPWGIAYTLSKSKYEKSFANAKAKGWSLPKQKIDEALRYFIIAIAVDWQELIDQLKRTLKLWGYTSKDLKDIAQRAWQPPKYSNDIAAKIDQAQNGNNIKLIEAIEKHETLNKKLFTEDGLLKDKVRDKMLEIVDEFISDLKEQEIKIKVDDILFIGSNASYNYTKDSDIDLHILANLKSVDYPADLGAALYSAYRSLFNKQLDIKIYDTDIEIFVETEDSARVSNGIYSVKKNKWIKKPVQEDIPEYDKEALKKLVDKWEDKCKKVLADAKADKLKDEDKVLKLIEDIYEQLRKKGIAKGEYALENLAFKELRNKGYLDELKDFKNVLVSKRLSLTEKLTNQMRANAYNQIAQIAGSQPIIQDNGYFFIYNLKASEIDTIVRKLASLPIVAEVTSNESGKYDFSKMPMTQMPSKYYNVRGKLTDTF
jgi:hypothetical protein